MRTRSFATALFSLTLTFASVGGVVALSIAKERAARPEILTADSCPPDSCTVVLKTTAGGPPSRLFPPASTEEGSSRPPTSGWAIAAREMPGTGP